MKKFVLSIGSFERKNLHGFVKNAPEQKFAVSIMYHRKKQRFFYVIEYAVFSISPSRILFLNLQFLPFLLQKYLKQV